jgi:hypothetical protein
MKALFKPVWVAIAATLCAPGALRMSAADAGSPEIYASVYHTNAWVEHNFEEIGIYRFDANSYNPQLVAQDPYLDASGGGAMTDDFYFCTVELNYGSWTEVTHYAFNPETWTEQVRLTDGNSNAVATDMTYDPKTAKVFGCFNNDSGDGYVFGTLDVGTGERFKIADLDVPWLACSVDRNGNLYAIGMDGVLMQVDKVYGTITTLANLGVEGSIRSTGAIDPQTGIFYFVVSHQSDTENEIYNYKPTVSSLYRVDLNDANPTATLCYELENGEVMGGMWIPGAVAEDDAPAAPTDMAVDFPNGALNGTFSFTVPTTTFGGGELSGEVSYLARANGFLLAQGKANPGEKVAVDARVSEADLYRVVLTLSNSAGTSPKASQSLWLGPDTPAPVTAVSLNYADGCFNLSWEAPTESAHGGYVDFGAVTYTVVRHPDEVTTNNITSPQFSDPVAMPTTMVAYRYDVIVNYNGNASTPVSTPVWRLGAMPLPYTATFEDDNALDLFTIVDVNDDTVRWYREWEWYIEDTDELVSVAAYPYSSRNEADDWLITPPFNFEAGKTYTLGYEAMMMSLDCPERLAVAIGTAPTADAMTTALVEPYTLASTTPALTTVDITVPESGVYYIGFHALSPADSYGLAISKITVDGEQSALPTLPADLSADASNTPVAYYNLQGVRLSAPQPGINIVRMADGTHRKLILR